MKSPRIFKDLAALASVAVSLLATPTATAQTVISNETLVSTTLVVNKHNVSAFCLHTYCSAKTPLFAAVPVICPAPTGKTCTFHISLDSKVSIFTGVTFFYQFLVDGAAPTIGPTDERGGYLFAQDVPVGQAFPLRQSYPAAIVATVTNSSSNTHTILVSVGCANNHTQSGCDVTAHWTTMRVDVFEP